MAMMAPACFQNATLQSTMLSILILFTSGLWSAIKIEKKNVATVLIRTVDLQMFNTLMMATMTIVGIRSL